MINSKNIIQQGEEVKYRIAIEREGFSMTEDPFMLTLKWGMQGRTLMIQKSEMLTDEHGNWFFTFKTADMVGVVTVECVYDVPDSDYPDGYRTEKEQQPLCFVNTSPRMPQMMRDGGGIYQGIYVSYERTLRSDKRSLFRYLRDIFQNYLRDINGRRLRVLKNN